MDQKRVKFIPRSKEVIAFNEEFRFQLEIERSSRGPSNWAPKLEGMTTRCPPLVLGKQLSMQEFFSYHYQEISRERAIALDL